MAAAARARGPPATPCAPLRTSASCSLRAQRHARCYGGPWVWRVRRGRCAPSPKTRVPALRRDRTAGVRRLRSRRSRGAARIDLARCNLEKADMAVRRAESDRRRGVRVRAVDARPRGISPTLVQTAPDPSGRWVAIVDEVEYPNGLLTSVADRVRLVAAASPNTEGTVVFSEDALPAYDNPMVSWSVAGC